MIRSAINLTPAALAALLAAPAFAQDAADPDEAVVQAPKPSWEFVIGAGTDNRSKEVSKSQNDPFFFAEAEWTSGDGSFYFAPSIETIKSSGSDVETVLAAGYRPQVMGFDLDLNVAHKWRLDANPGVDAEFWELTADVKRSIGPVDARLRIQHSPDGAGATEAWTWTEARVGWELNPTTLIRAAVGRREQDGSVDYTGWNAGVTWSLTRDLDLDVRWHDTDAHTAGEAYEGALVATVSKFF